MRRLMLLLPLILMLGLSVSAQERLEQQESDGFSWTRIMSDTGEIGALDAYDSLIVPMRYCYVVYSKGLLICDSCEGDYIVGKAAYDTEGNCIIPAERKYLKISKVNRGGGISHSASRWTSGPFGAFATSMAAKYSHLRCMPT